MNHDRSSFKLKRDNERAYRYQAATARANAKKAMQKHAEANAITCFVCKTAGNEIARMGQSKYGTWAICVPCVKQRKKQHRTSG